MLNKVSITLGLALAIVNVAACQSNPAAQTTQTAGLQPTMQAGKTIAVGKTPHGMTALAGFVYNSNIGDHSISVIESATDTIVKTIDLGDGVPGYMKPSPDGKTVLALDTGKGELMVIDPTKDHQVVQRVPVGQGADKIVLNHDDAHTVYISLTKEPKVVQLTFGDDPTQAPARKDFAVGSAGTAEHRAIAFDHGYLVAPNAGDNSVSLVKVDTGETKTVTDGNGPGPVAVGVVLGTPTVAAVGNAVSNTVTLFDMVSGDKTTLDAGLAPTDIAVDEELKRMFVTMAGSNEVAVIDYVAKKLLIRIPVGARPVHIFQAPDMPPAAYSVMHGAGSHQYWVGNDSGDSVTVIDGELLKSVATIGTGKGHHKMAFWGSKAYVSNITDNTVAVIDRTTVR